MIRYVWSDLDWQQWSKLVLLHRLIPDKYHHYDKSALINNWKLFCERTERANKNRFRTQKKMSWKLAALLFKLLTMKVETLNVTSYHTHINSIKNKILRELKSELLRLSQSHLNYKETKIHQIYNKYKYTSDSSVVSILWASPLLLQFSRVSLVLKLAQNINLKWNPSCHVYSFSG